MVLNIVLNYLMIPVLGIVGAAIATLTSNVAVWSILAFLSRREFGIFFSPSYMAKPAIASLAMLAVLIHITPRTVSEGIAAVLFGVVVYFVALYLIRGVGREDVKYLMKVFSR